MTVEIEEFASYPLIEVNKLDPLMLPAPSATQTVTPGTAPVTSTAFSGVLVRVVSDTPAAVTVGTAITVVRRMNEGPAASRLLPHPNPVRMIPARPQYFVVAAGDTLTVLAQPPLTASPF